MWNAGDRLINQSGWGGIVEAVDGDGENITVRFDNGQTGRFGRDEWAVLEEIDLGRAAREG